MRSSTKIPVLTGLFLALTFGACRKDTRVTFGVKDEVIYDDKSQKTKEKSGAEYISILYTNLYQVPISPNQLYKTQSVINSIGDRNVANEMILSNYFNTSGLKIPADTTMHNNPEAFIVSSYKRFFLRFPSEGEKTWFINYIVRNPGLSVEMVFTAMASSNEYQFY